MVVGEQGKKFKKVVFEYEDGETRTLTKEALTSWEEMYEKALLLYMQVSIIQERARLAQAANLAPAQAASESESSELVTLNSVLGTP